MLPGEIEFPLAEPETGGEKPGTPVPSDVGSSSARARIQKIRAHQKAWREKNKDKMRQYVEQWKARNPEKVASYRNRNKTGCTPTMLLGLMAAQNGLCALCGQNLELARHLDHIIPKSKGGGSNLTNYQYLCPTCNAAKGVLTNEEFIEHIGKILRFIGG